MKTQKFVDLLNSSGNEYLKFPTKNNGRLLTVNEKVFIQKIIQ